MRTLLLPVALGLAALARPAASQAPAPAPAPAPAAAAAAPPATAAPPAAARGARAARLDNTLTVQNDRKVPVTVYMDDGNFDRRLGVVPPFGTKRLALPSWAVRDRTEIRLFVHPEGEVADLASQTFSLRPPARLALVVPPVGVSLAARHAPRDTMTADIPPQELADATVTVDNPRAVPVTVFAEQGDFEVRLGQVPARGRATLVFPKSIVWPDGSIRVFLHPEGGLDLASETLPVRAGDHLGIRVPAR